MNYKGLISNKKKGSLASVTESDILVTTRPPVKGKEDVINKVTDLSVMDDTTYLTTKGIRDYVLSTLDGSGTNKSPALHIPSPKGGKTQLNSSNVSGAIKIKFPIDFTVISNFSMQLHLWGQQFEGNPKDAAIIHIVGRTTSIDSGEFSATIITNDEKYDFPIRFGNDGSKYCIWIGELNYTFSYISIGIVDLFVSRSSADPAWKEAFDISRVQAFETTDILLQENLPASKINKGLTSNRPATSIIGFQYFDTTIGLPIWWNGTDWVNASGTVV